MVSPGKPYRLFVNLLVGVFIGVITVITTVSLVAPIFTGGMSARLAEGIGIALVSAVIVGSIFSLGGSCSAAIAMPQDRTAPIVAHEKGRVYELISEALARMEAERPELASVLHRFMAGVLVQRLLYTTRTLEAVLEQPRQCSRRLPSAALAAKGIVHESVHALGVLVALEGRAL